MELLKRLCAIHGPSGNEAAVKNFIIDHVKANNEKWACTPEVISGDDLQDALILKFGEPRTAVFAHMDTVGFTVRYHDQLIPIGQPEAASGYELAGRDALGPIECRLVYEQEAGLRYDFARALQRGTELVFKPNFRETKDFVQSPALDNRLGVYATLKLAETLRHGLIVYTCWEEHGGGSVPFLAKYVYENYGVRSALIADITWVTEGVQHGNGVAISMRDNNIPRRSFINKIINLAAQSGIDYQLEVEAYGSSDGRELQRSPYPFDWCFVGAPQDRAHSPEEIVHKRDVACMIDMYRFLLEHL